MSPPEAAAPSSDRAAPVLVALFGPTGVGKTAVALALADALRTRGEDPVAVSADALAVYRGLEVLTGAPSAAERERLEHRLVGVVGLERTFSVGEFMPLAHGEIDGALATGRRPIVVGGTGLYLRAALADLDLRPPPAAGARELLERAADERGVAALHAELTRRAPRIAEGVAPGDRSRVIRELELLGRHSEGPAGGSGHEPPGGGPADALDGDPVERDQLWSGSTRHPTLLVALVMDRDELYRRIDDRVDAMVAAGAVEEVRRADAAGASATARKALGFEALLRGDVEAMKRDTRRLAKRQLTWLRKLGGAKAIDVTGREATDVAGEIACDLPYSARPPMAASSLSAPGRGPA